MGTTAYFDENVTDVVTNERISIEAGTTSFVGPGPQLYLNFDGKSVIFSHKEAQAFCAALSRIAGYFNYPDM
ncbi:hypothetical protein [Mesorhizobium sp. ES1-4]|uniref:hypothetical protein n=1 Tax=Mesorhizobium sp. ES1-4 TaxID=2876627 RepID=UPI001CCB3B8B|nr:hypothetical protein [Mesorhizobium sp. ES1-4]MBZ9794808.1 hypothetical protein [Mesorhizobium sp. ES1-4]